MMLPQPRIIAIDDELEHLEELTTGLNRYGAACLSMHFTGDAAEIPLCPHVRVIFADLHLNAGPPGEHAQHFATLGGLIEESIRPSGPYFVILWTRYPEQAQDLFGFLRDRLQHAPTPFAVHALDKTHLRDPEDTVRSVELVVGAIERIVSEHPQIRALFNWEERILGAAAEVVSSVMELAESAGEGVNPDEEIGRLLASLAEGAVGEAHVERERFRAVNNALLPVLDDRIASMRSREADNALWEVALGEVQPRLSLNEAAKLNRLLHIAPSDPDCNSAERGSVIELPERLSGEAFMEKFDLDSNVAAHKQFWRKEPGEDAVPARWVLVQTQAACDYAQMQPGPLPFHLGLCLPVSRARSGTPPAALWRSPCFELDGQPALLHVNARFHVSLTRCEIQDVPPIFRLREQILNDLIYQLHGYGARPGMVSFRNLR